MADDSQAIQHDPTKENWPNDAGQFEVWRFDDATLDLWEESARVGAWRAILGQFNWPMAVRSLCAEVRALRKEIQGD